MVKLSSSALVCVVALTVGSSAFAATARDDAWHVPGFLARAWRTVTGNDKAAASAAPLESEDTAMEPEAQMTPGTSKFWQAPQDFILGHPKLAGLLTALDAYLGNQAEFYNLVLNSLGEAQAEAFADLDADLYSHLSWPTTINDWLDYLASFGTYTPMESSASYWLEPGTAEHQEVYDRLAHFYYLISFENETTDELPQDDTFFAGWLVDYAEALGDHLDDPISFNETILQSFIDDSPNYEVESSMIGARPNSASGWQTFNQFFSRRLNPGMRYIKESNDNKVVTSPCDCYWHGTYDISGTSTFPEITIKGTHEFETVSDLIGANSPYKDTFLLGKMVHYVLPLYAYHRVHSPVAGQVLESYNMHGHVNLGVKISRKGVFKTQEYAFDGFQFSQMRGVTIIDTTDSPYGNVGKIAVVAVGMGHVGSVNMVHANDTFAQKGDELSYFAFGGSDVLVLFQANAHADVNQTAHFFRVGNEVVEADLFP